MKILQTSTNYIRVLQHVPGGDIFNLDKIFFACNVNKSHWCCVVIFMQEKRIQFYDSMHASGKYYLNHLMNYIVDEWNDKKSGNLPDAEKWKLVKCEPDVPHQKNGFDCGVFTCMFADYLSCDKKFNFHQDLMVRCRESIALALMDGNII